MSVLTDARAVHVNTVDLESPEALLPAVRREFRRSRRVPHSPRFPARGLERLPRIAQDEALRVLLGWRDDPARFDAGAVAWHARLVGHAADLTLADAECSLATLRGLRGPAPEWAARRLSELSRRYGLDDVAAVLDDWIEQHRGRGCC
jgi:hypothetical protein